MIFHDKKHIHPVSVGGGMLEFLSHDAFWYCSSCGAVRAALYWQHVDALEKAGVKPANPVWGYKHEELNKVPAPFPKGWAVATEKKDDKEVYILLCEECIEKGPFGGPPLDRSVLRDPRESAP